MWLIFNLKNEFKKIKESFNKSHKDIKINSKELKELREQIVSKKEIDLMIREELLKVKSEQHSEPKSEPNKETHYNKVMIKKAVKNRPELIKQAIRGLIERDMNTTNIFNAVVLEKKLCGKTQFYHYLSLVKQELRTELRPELRTKHK